MKSNFNQLVSGLDACKQNLSLDEFESRLNEQDLFGNTPLLLAVKMTRFSKAMIQIVNHLLQLGAKTKIKDGNGWRIMEEAIVQQNPNLLVVIFDWMTLMKKQKWMRNQAKMLQRLDVIPDFYLEMHWECQSNWIPFLYKLAPNDTLQIWKAGRNVRLDFSLVGFSKLKNKRRLMTLLVTPDKNQTMQVRLLNRSKGIVVDPLEDLD